MGTTLGVQDGISGTDEGERVGSALGTLVGIPVGTILGLLEQ